jgi:hypothetical protein
MCEFPKGKRYFYLEEIGELDGNTLRLVVQEAVAQGTETDIPETALTGRAIVPVSTARPLELVWENYIAYAVRNESYAIPVEGQPPLESMLSEQFKSAFLTFVAHSTLATAEYPGSYRHWELVCLDHVVDVASTMAPVVRSL